MYHPLQKRKITSNSQTDEILTYLRLPEPPLNKPILEWWKENQLSLPTLSKIAKDYLAIPATSAPSERLFSEAGNLITLKQVGLSGDPEKANMILTYCLKEALLVEAERFFLNIV